MDNLVAIGVGLGLRALIDTLTNHNHRLNGSLVGLWEGAILRHFISKYPASIDPYVAYGFRLLIDLLWTTSWMRLFITILWSFMGMLLSDVFVDLYADRRFRRFMRFVRHSVIYPLLRLFSLSGSRTSSGGGSNRSTSSSARAQYYQLPPSSSGASNARSPPLEPRSPTDASRAPFRPPAPTPAPPRRSAMRVPGSFSDRGWSETDTNASATSRTPVQELSRPPTRDPSLGPPRPRTPSELEYVTLPVIPDVERRYPIRPVLSDDEQSVHSDLRGRSSGLTTPEKDEDRPRINVYSPELVKSGLTTPERPSTPHSSLPPVTVFDEAGSHVSSDVNPIPIPIRLYERNADHEDQAQARAALLHPELIPDINTPQPSPGLIPPADYMQNMHPGPGSTGPVHMPEPEVRSDVRTSITAPPPYEYPLDGGEGEGGENRLSQVESDGTPAGSVISNVNDRTRLLQRAESLRSIADEADKRRAELGKQLQDARRNRDFWAAFRVKHEMDRAAHDARELHAKAARRFYQAHNMKPQPQTIDVHRLKVPEAIEKVEQALYDSIVTGTPELRIITGQGHHSKNKIPALKLAIIGAMADYHIDATQDSTNPGVLLIHPPSNPNFKDGPSTSS
ncbi:uncharacterized protein TRAVEDRAFT_161434 [Trametes versicolor FP-101664 SS1]|uniref:uncharacterized protein n=1 Tax=Trametes versicolor (strain FP-101664) TaxID=717944 RepID=UPI0004623088|nr:uncharacterized protein TRAVEDRAFT_161434 [Trametes versicolor FP-101664 SS1]EIW63262.1 hypothetical protein TRAVEDRAFT_161434 [Trametes versicolor FP-101664 SS1]